MLPYVFFPWSPFDLVCFLFALLWEQYFVFALLVFVFCFVCVCFVFNVPEHCLHLFINVFCDTDLIPLCSICRWFQQSRFMCKCISQESLFHLRFCLLYFCFFLNLTQSINRNKFLCRNCFHWELWVSFVSSSVLYLLSGFVCVVQSFKSICLFVFVCLCFILGNFFCFCFRKFLLHHFSFLRLLFMFSYARCALGGAHHHYSAFVCSIVLHFMEWYLRFTSGTHLRRQNAYAHFVQCPAQFASCYLSVYRWSKQICKVIRLTVSS